MAGSPGAGKSTVATLLGEALPAVVLDKDVVKSSLLESGIPEATAAPAAYEVFFALADSLLGQGHSVVLDSPSYYPFIPATGVEMASARGVEYVFVECACPLHLIRERVEGRTPMRSQGGSATDRPSARPGSGRIVVADTGGPATAALSAVLATLGLPGDAVEATRADQR